MLSRLRLRAPSFMSRSLFLFAVLFGALFLLAPVRASTTLNFSIADSNTVTAFIDYYNYDVNMEFYGRADFSLPGGSGATGLTLGTPKTVHVGTSKLIVDPKTNDGTGTADDLARSFSLTGTAGTVTQPVVQPATVYVYPEPNRATANVSAGPTVTFDLGTQGRVDVTPQAFSYDTSSGSAAPKGVYTLLLRVPASPPSGLAVTPSPVTYPATATATITLAKPAPDAEIIALKSSNPAAASIPATVTTTAGQQTITFPIATYRVDSDTAVTISAAAGGTTKSVSLTVKTRPETAIAYNIAGYPTLQKTDGEAEIEFSATGGSGTVKLAQEIPYTITVGAYDVGGDVDGDGSADLDADIVRSAKLDSLTQSLNQHVNASISGHEDEYGEQSIDEYGSVSASQTLIYDLGSKGRVELTALSWSDDGESAAPPAQYTFLLHAPNKASSLLISPGKIYGGATTYGKITLASAAGTGGQTVMLKTSDPSLMGVPASVVVPEGVKSAVFSIYTQEPDEDTPVTLTATAGGASMTAALTILTRYEFSGTVKSGSAGLSGVTVNASSTGSFTLTSAATPNAAIPDSSTTGVTSTIVPKGTGTITGLVVGVDITHPYIGDLRITLKGPDGTTAILYDQSGGNQKDILASYPVLRTPVNSLSVFNGKPVAGTWSLLVQDLSSQDVGTFNSWNLTFTYNGTYTGSGTTASNGTYTVSNLKEGTFTATPTKSGYTFTPTSRSVTVGPTAVDPNPSGIDFAKK